MGMLNIDPISLLAFVPAHHPLLRTERLLGMDGFTLRLKDWPEDETLTIGDWLASGAPGAPDPFRDPADHLVAGIIATMTDGRKFTLSPQPRRSVGPDMSALFVGCHHRFGRILSAWLRIHPLSVTPSETAPFSWQGHVPLSQQEETLLQRIDSEISRRFPRSGSR